MSSQRPGAARVPMTAHDTHGQAAPKWWITYPGHQWGEERGCRPGEGGDTLVAAAAAAVHQHHQKARGRPETLSSAARLSAARDIRAYLGNV
ncbi:hypothetical protein [Streptomyces sp. I6]|uniref:hypothetical protein n=1 Tax=Streptomyces sp. I6 TaxID=2483113 RepID=UPI000F453906|nr:hypothetical protein EBF04_13235 [Streptomyces sp. I6]